MRTLGNRLPVLVLFILSLVIPSAQSAEEPIWILKFEHEKPRRITVGEDRTGEVDVYWYLVYRLTNEDEQAHKFFLDITAESDKEATYHDTFHKIVHKKVKKRLGLDENEKLWGQVDVTFSGRNTDPDAPFPRKLNLPEIPAQSTITCVAIFEAFDPEMDHLKISFRGLTNDIVHKRTGVPNEREVTERVLYLKYERPGDEFAATEDSLSFVGKEWATETRIIKTDLR